VQARDRLGGAGFEIRGRVFVNAAGPWADRLLQLAGHVDNAPALVRSKGIHLVTRPVLNGHALALMRSGRHLFAVPWRGLTLFGTTDTRFDAAPDDVRPEPEDIAALLQHIREELPAVDLQPHDIRYAYAGLRPLVADPNAGDVYNASRHSEVVEHGDSGGPANLVSVLGGKWTTSRRVAETVVDGLARRLGVPVREADTDQAPLPYAPEGRFAAFEAEVRRAHAGLPAATAAYLARNYGARLPAVLACADGRPELLQPLSPEAPVIGAEVVHAVRHEMAMTLEDVVLRRTDLAARGAADAPALAAVGRLMAEALGWGPGRAVDEADRVARRLPGRVSARVSA
jgi:glycerol-3-phosphate dehydrogenase